MSCCNGRRSQAWSQNPRVQGSIPWRPTKLVIARTPSLLALAGALSLARALFVTAAVSWSVLGWGMRYLGVMVLGLVILISAMRVSIRALRVWSLPESMTLVM